jgi:hypothetical protein
MQPTRWCGALVLLALASILVMLMSCQSGSTFPWGIERARANLNRLEVGMTKDQVLAIMGKPYSREVFPDEAGRPVEILIYVTQYTESGAIPDSDKTPVCLRDGKVVGWGRNFYERTQKQEITIKAR